MVIGEAAVHRWQRAASRPSPPPPPTMRVPECSQWRAAQVCPSVSLALAAIARAWAVLLGFALRAVHSSTESALVTFLFSPAFQRSAERSDDRGLVSKISRKYRKRPSRADFFLSQCGHGTVLAVEQWCWHRRDRRSADSSDCGLRFPRGQAVLVGADGIWSGVSRPGLLTD